MEEKFGLYIVDPDDVEGSIEGLGYEDVKNLANECVRENSIEDLMRYLVEGLNYDTISDQNFFYVTDEEKGIILFGR